MGKQKLSKWSWSHEQDGHHAHGKKLFKNLLPSQKADDLGTWYTALGMWAYKVDLLNAILMRLNGTYL